MTNEINYYLYIHLMLFVITDRFNTVEIMHIANVTVALFFMTCRTDNYAIASYVRS